MEHPDVGIIGLVIVVNSVSGVVFFERKFAFIISWVSLCFWDELEESLDFLLFFEGSLGDFIVSVTHFSQAVAHVCLMLYAAVRNSG